MKLKRMKKGFYIIENAPYGNTEINIYNIKRGLWVWNIDGGMTKGTAWTLREIKKMISVKMDLGF